MAIQYDKPFLDYEKMINLMISRGIQVSDRSFAKRALSSLSYYTLVNGYKDTFLSVNNIKNRPACGNRSSGEYRYQPLKECWNPNTFSILLFGLSFLYPKGVLLWLQLRNCPLVHGGAGYSHTTSSGLTEQKNLSMSHLSSRIHRSAAKRNASAWLQSGRSHTRTGTSWP